jgi:hypothetical protein
MEVQDAYRGIYEDLAEQWWQLAKQVESSKPSAANRMVTQSHKDDPAYWRKRAKELRELAHNISHLDHKEEILVMAQS